MAENGRERVRLLLGFGADIPSGSYAANVVDRVSTFVAQEVAAERAACAALCDAVVEEFKQGTTWEPWTAGEAAKRIRARGTT